MTEPAPTMRPAILMPLGIGALIWISASGLGLLPLMFSPMLFDAPGSTSNQWVLGMLGGLFALPVLTVLSVLASLFLVYRESRATVDKRIAWAVALLPGLGPLIFVVSIIGLQIFCGGSFNCR